MQVSVIIAAFNAAAHLERALDSVRRQTLADWEVIVVDDCSTDRTAALVEAAAKADGRIGLLRLEANGGPSIARNAGIEQARGEWIAILDADDAWRPERLEQMLNAAAATGSDFVADNQIMFDGEAGVEYGLAFAPRGAHAPLSVELLLDSDHPRSEFKLGYMKPVLRRRLFQDLGVRYDPAVRLAEDFFLYAELLMKGVKGTLLGGAYYIYTAQRGGISGQASSASRTVFTPQTRLRIATELRQRYGAGLSAREAAALGRYERWMFEAALRQSISDLRRAGQYGRLLLTVARHPRASLTWISKQLRDRNPRRRFRPLPISAPAPSDKVEPR